MKARADDVVDAAKADLPAIEVPVGFNVRKLSAGSLGGFGFAAAFAAAPAGGQTPNNYYTIEKVDLLGAPAATKAAGTLWNGVRRQMRMGAI